MSAKPIYAPTENTATGAPLFSADPSIGMPATIAAPAAGAHHHNPYAFAAANHQQRKVHQPAAAPTHQQLQQQHQQMMMLNAIHLQQQQQQMMHQQHNAAAMMMMQQQQAAMAAAAMQQQMMAMSSSAVPSPMVVAGNKSANATNARSSRSPMNATNNANNNGASANTTTRGPSTPFNPAAAMPLEDMIVAYNNIKAREIEMQNSYAVEVAAHQNDMTGTVPCPNAFVSPFVDYACSQQGKLVLQGLLHFEDEVAVAYDLFLSVGNAIETIALNEHGCHVIRALGEKIGNAASLEADETDGSPAALAAVAEATKARNEASLQQFIGALHETLFLNICTLSQESRRIPQALFETYNTTKPELFAPLVDIVARNVLYLSATQQGCIAFMRMYEASNFAQKRQMAANLVRIIADLSCDSFGNYVVQCLVEHSEMHVAAQYVSSAFVGQCVRLACNKFASNVMEKTIRKLSHIPSVRRVVLEELVFDHTNATICCEDSYANFVIQTLIETSANAAEFRKIHDRVKASVANSMYAAKIEARLRSKNFFTNGGNNANATSTAASAGNNGMMMAHHHNAQHHNLTVAAPSVVVGNTTATAPTAANKGNSPVMAAMMAAAAAAAAQMQQQQHAASATTTPVYNKATAPSTPVGVSAPNTNNAKGFAGLPHDAAIVVGAPKRTITAPKPADISTGATEMPVVAAVTAASKPSRNNNNNNKQSNKYHNNNNNNNRAASEEKENNNNSHHYNKKASSPAAAHNNNNTGSITATVKPQDPLQAEAKRLLNSDQPPSSFTPYKPSPFHDRSNRQNNNNNTNGKPHQMKQQQQSSAPRNNNSRGGSAESAAVDASSSPRSSNNFAPRRQNNNNYHNRREQQVAH